MCEVKSMPFPVCCKWGVGNRQLQMKKDTGRVKTKNGKAGKFTVTPCLKKYWLRYTRN